MIALTLAEIAAATGGELVDAPDPGAVVTGPVVVDSRSSTPGALFVAVRGEILNAAPGAIEIGDRAAAIAEAVSNLERGDVLLVAGKGHETGQTIGATEIPFSDHDAVQAALKQEAKCG